MAVSITSITRFWINCSISWASPQLKGKCHLIYIQIYRPLLEPRRDQSKFERYAGITNWTITYVAYCAILISRISQHPIYQYDNYIRTSIVIKFYLLKKKKMWCNLLISLKRDLHRFNWSRALSGSSMQIRTGNWIEEQAWSIYIADIGHEGQLSIAKRTFGILQYINDLDRVKVRVRARKKRKNERVQRWY